MSQDSIKHYTRGGQITLHNLRMFTQITHKVALVTAGVFILVVGIIAWFKVSEYERYVYGQYLLSTVVSSIEEKAETDFIQPNGVKIRVKYADIQHATLIKKVKQNVTVKFLHAILIGAVIATITMIILTIWLRRRGQAQTEDISLKGDKIASREETKARIIKAKLHSDLALGGLPLIKDSETTHFLFHGTVGSGKSNAIKELLDQIRKRGDRAIIYDKSCNYVEEFFNPCQDYLLNPLDRRGLPWDLWQECRDPADFDSLAAAQIPMKFSAQDPYWVDAARTVFSVAAYQMRNDADRSINKLLRVLLTADFDLIQQYLKGTEAETLMSEKIEKTALSVKSMLATYLKSLKYVTDGPGSFSIRKWIQDEQAEHWLFITSLGDRHETLKPLISSWLDIAVNTLMSLTPDPERRIWFILDEVPTLHQLPSLSPALSEARKFGGPIVLGLQNFAQFSKLYGLDGAREISSLLNTRVIFRQPDPDMARWSANNFGESIIDEVRENISYGANSIRDGISINRIEARKPVISYSEIMSLPNLSAYVRLPGEFPITNINFTYKKRKKINIGLLEKDISDTSMQEIDQLFDVVKKGATSGSPQKSILSSSSENTMKNIRKNALKKAKNMKKTKNQIEENIVNENTMDLIDI